MSNDFKKDAERDVDDIVSELQEIGRTLWSTNALRGRQINGIAQRLAARQASQPSTQPELDAAIGNVLDHWEQVPNDLQTDPGYEALHNSIKKLYECRVRQPSHASGEPVQHLTDFEHRLYGVDAEKIVIEQAYQRGQQAMAEKAAQTLYEHCKTVIDGNHASNGVREAYAAIRSLAGAEPDFIPNKENE